jgi:hypothetical protein
MLGLCLWFYDAGPTLLAQDEEGLDDDATRVVTQQGLHFKLPEDWPIEKRNGVVAPIPVEEYLSSKTKLLESRIHTLEQQLSSMDLRMLVLEEKLSSQRGLRSGEQR